MAGCVVALALVLAVALPAIAGALPSGRVYEMVTPPFKGGYGVGGLTSGSAAPNGDAYSFSSVGLFAGAPSNGSLGYYMAARGSSGWQTAPLNPPVALGDYTGPEATSDFSWSLGTALSEVGLGQSNYGRAQQECVLQFFSHQALTAGGAPTVDAAALYTPVSPSLSEPKKCGNTYMGATPDLSHIFFVALAQLTPEDTASEQTGALYEVETGSDALRVVTLDNKGELIDQECLATLGGISLTESFRAISATGSVVFTSNVNPSAGPNACNSHETHSNPVEVYDRIEHAHTVEASRPEGDKECGSSPTLTEELCNGANRNSAFFQGASEDGSRVFFTTTGKLISEDSNDSEDLYMAVIGGDTRTKLVQVSHDPREGSEAAEVQGVVRMSSDSSHVYYVARGVLTSKKNGDGALPVPGADNLYLYEAGEGASAGTTKFVGDLCSGPETSGVVPDPRCGAKLNSQVGYSLSEGKRPINDSMLWEGEGQTQRGEDERHRAQVNECEPGAPGASCEAGRYLAFSSYAQLTTADHDQAADVYRYDAATERLTLVSIGESGYEAGSHEELDVNVPRGFEFKANATIHEPNFRIGWVKSQYELNSRAVSENGSRIVFATAAPLSPRASNGLPDAYEWRETGPDEGQVGLISTGTATEEDSDPIITPSGRDIFFETLSGIAPEDVDGETDVYDARMAHTPGERLGFPEEQLSSEGCRDECQGPLSAPSTLLAPASATQTASQGAPPAPSPKSAPKPPKRAQNLAAALKMCRKLAMRRRQGCEKSARKRYLLRKRYGVKSKARRGGRR